MKITKKRYLSFFLALLMALSLAWGALAQAAPAPEAGEGAPAGSETAPTPEVSQLLADLEPPRCKEALLMDAQSGQVLYHYLAPGAEEHNYPASITKVMTALLVLEAVDRGELSLGQTITASDTFGADLQAGGSTANIQSGEQMSVEDLLYCLLLPSANEAANILAEAVCGDVTTFVARMNQRAQELGMTETNFANAHGLHNASHYTTAHDLALLVRQALKNDTFVTIVSSRSHTVPPTNLTEKERRLTNTNALVNGSLYNGNYSYPKAIGVKTGSTTEAGKCLASAARKGKDTLICIVLGSEEVRDEEGNLTRYQFAESKRLLQWGFDTFHRVELISADPVTEIPVKLSADTTAVALKPQEIPQTMLPTDMDPANFQHDITLYRDEVEAPVEAGQALGEMTIRNGDTTYATVKLVAAASAQRSTFLSWMWKLKSFFAKTWVKVALVAVVVAVVVCVIRVSRGKSRRGYRGSRGAGKRRSRR